MKTARLSCLSACLCLLLAAALPVRADGGPYADAPWVRMGGIPSLYDVVRALAVDEAAGRLYAGGDFTFMGNRIACWDGSQWQALGTGINGPVHAVAVAGGQVYAGGLFTQAGGVPVSNIARWDGTAWHAVGAGVNGRVSALLVDGADVYAGGEFTASSGTTLNHVARWDGSAWHALGTPAPGLNGPVRALARDASGLHAGGEFTAGARGNYAVFDGTQWSGGGPGAGFNGAVRALAFHNGELLAGGDFTQADGSSAGRIARWNGAGFGPVFPGDTGMNAPVNALISFGGELIAGGDFGQAGGVTTTGIARTDGASWSAMHQPALNLKEYGSQGVLAFAVFDGRLRAGGDFDLSTGIVSDIGIMTWSGETWQGFQGDGFDELAGPQGENVAMTEYMGELYVGAEVYMAGGKLFFGGLGRWDGSTWSSVGGSFLGEVKCLTVADGQLYVGGSIAQAGGMAVSNIARWDGSAWHPLGAGVGGGAVRAIAVHGGQVYAAGEFTSAGGQPASRIARWDGSAWHPLGAGMDGPVRALAFYNGELYAGGDFFEAGGVSAPYLARWDGSAWQRVGTEMDELDDQVVTLAVYEGELYAGGWFDSVGSLFTGRVARWNGTSWSAPGGGLDGSEVNALLVDGGVLYAAGLNLDAPGGGSCLVRWDGTAWSRVSSSGAADNSWVCAMARVGQRLYVAGEIVENYDGFEYLAYVELPFTGSPELVVEQPAGVARAPGATVDFGPLALGTASAPAAVLVRNTGTAALTLGGVGVTGAAGADYTLDLTGLLTEVPAGGQTSFTLAFTPGGTVSGARAAQVEIGSDAAGSPFVLNLTGLALSPAGDADVDGLNDWAEHRLAALGFDWQVAQPALVAALFDGAGAAGLFTAAQVQALHVGTPLIQRNAGTGVFTLTLGLEKSVTLEPESFQPFPVTAPQITVNGQGKIEFHFTPGDDAAFYLLRAQ